MEIYTSPLPPPQIRDRKLARFGFCAVSSLICRGGGWLLGVGWLAVPFYSVQDCSQDYCGMGCERKNLYRSMSITYFYHPVFESVDFRLYWRVSILNTKLINHEDLCVGGEGKSMLGVNAHTWRKLITCKTLKTLQHGIVPWIAFTSNWHVRLFSPSAGISLISFRNISTVHSEKTPK